MKQISASTNKKIQLQSIKSTHPDEEIVLKDNTKQKDTITKSTKSTPPDEEIDHESKRKTSAKRQKYKANRQNTKHKVNPP